MSRPCNVDPSLPEHKKLKTIQPESQSIGSFLEWLQNEQGVVLAQYHEHDDGCEDEGRRKVCGYCDDDLAPIHQRAEYWLSRYFKIDVNVLEEEKRFMLAQLQKGD